ncbi:hypothetical protein BC826DRAFT_988838 [Russula brevipes]|nr:hypothetical protein BC826DRAFT_988838 [Russula brevipes]
MGKAGQISSISLTGVSLLQRSRRSKWRGEAKTRSRHLRHTCTSVCHSSRCSDLSLYGRLLSFI